MKGLRRKGTRLVYQEMFALKEAHPQVPEGEGLVFAAATMILIICQAFSLWPVCCQISEDRKRSGTRLRI